MAFLIAQRTKKTVEEVRSIWEYDHFLSAEEAVEFGVVDTGVIYVIYIVQSIKFRRMSDARGVSPFFVVVGRFLVC